MNPTAFAIVKSEVNRLPLVEDKIQAIVHVQGNFYAEQVADLLKDVDCDDDNDDDDDDNREDQIRLFEAAASKMPSCLGIVPFLSNLSSYKKKDDQIRVLEAAASKMLPASCLGIVPILRAISSDKKKVQAVQLLSRQIIDPLNFHVWNFEVFPYQEHRDLVQGIMTSQASAGAPPFPASNHVLYSGNPYPYGPSRPNHPFCGMKRTTFASAGNPISPMMPAAGGVVIRRPGAVVYQTTSVPNYPTVGVFNPASGHGVQAIQTGPPPSTGAVQYTVVNPPPAYSQQKYYRK